MPKFESYYKDLHEQVDILMGLKEIGTKTIVVRGIEERHKIFAAPSFESNFTLHRFKNSRGESCSAVYDENNEEFASCNREGEYDMLVYYIEHYVPNMSKSEP